MDVEEIVERVVEDVYDFEEETSCVCVPIERVNRNVVRNSIRELEKRGLALIEAYCEVSITEREKSYCVEVRTVELTKKLFFPKSLYNAEDVVEILENHEFTDLVYRDCFLKKIALCFMRKDENGRDGESLVESNAPRSESRTATKSSQSFSPRE